jgi:predicted thioesterase
MITKGLTYTVEITVEDRDTAKALGSGELDVLATPRMVALMEEASSKCIKAELSEDESSVGTLLEIKHVSATPVGMRAKATAEVTEVNGRRVLFDVRAEDEKGLIGEGKHERFIINKEKFVEKTYQKLSK